MKQGWFAWLDRRRRGLARVLVLAMVLPLLLSLISNRAVSAEEALQRDLALSVCAAEHADETQRSHTSHHGQACVLCQVGCVMAQAAEAPQQFEAGAWQRGAATCMAAPRIIDPRRLVFWRSALRARAPPLT